MRSVRLPTPLVLAATSAMVCVGLVGMWASRAPAEDGERSAATAPNATFVVDASTPERAAESFLDAWRRRAHDTAARLSVGPALEQVRARAQRDARMSDHERELKAQVWDAMASERLRLRLRSAENLDGGGLHIEGVAEGSFLGHPYSRAVEFTLRPEGDEWRVADFAFGEILSELPGSLDLSDD